jgi:hypothetical protein
MESDRAWIVLLGSAFGYNLIAGHKNWELLSGGAQRHRAKHPLLYRLFIMSVVGHLTGALPRWADPFHWQYWKLIPYRKAS